jgi:hypothetical protein
VSIYLPPDYGALGPEWPQAVEHVRQRLAEMRKGHKYNWTNRDRWAVGQLLRLVEAREEAHTDGG